ncbi:WD40-repeat-containing domain protein [Trichoderma barbatum]
MNRQRQLFLWDTDTGDLIREVGPFWDCSSGSIAISPDSAILARTSSTGHTEFWSIDTGECVAEIPTCCYSIAFPPNWRNSPLMALQLENNLIQTWLVNDNQTMPEGQHSGHLFQNIVVSPDSTFVASKRQLYGDINVWSGEDGQVVRVFEGDGLSFFPPTFSPDSKLLASARGNFIHLQCVSTGEVVRLLECPGSPAGSARVSSVALSSDPKHLVAGNFAGEIYIWRIDSGQLIYRYDFGIQPMHSKGQLVAISPDSARVAAFWDSGIALHANIWHLKTGRNVAIKLDREAWDSAITLHANIWHCLIESRYSRLSNTARIFFSSDSAILASITAPMAQIFDVATGACLQSFDLGKNEHTRLLSFDQIKGRILAAYTVYKTSSWEHWQTSLQLGYSYDYRQGDSHVSESGTWILLNGKRNCYVPSHFRPGLLPRYEESIDQAEPLLSNSFTVIQPDCVNVAMSDSLYAVVNELREMVIIKLPPLCEAQQQAIGPSDVRSMIEGIPGSAGNPNLAAGAPATTSFDLRYPIRKRHA